jgi:hypothetical protein
MSTFIVINCNCKSVLYLFLQFSSYYFFLWQCQVDEWLRDFTEEMAPGTQSEILAIYLAKHSAQLKLSYGELLYDLKIARN